MPWSTPYLSRQFPRNGFELKPVNVLGAGGGRQVPNLGSENHCIRIAFERSKSSKIPDGADTCTRRWCNKIVVAHSIERYSRDGRCTLVLCALLLPFQKGYVLDIIERGWLDKAWDIKKLGYRTSAPKVKWDSRPWSTQTKQVLTRRSQQPNMCSSEHLLQARQRMARSKAGWVRFGLEEVPFA